MTNNEQQLLIYTDYRGWREFCVGGTIGLIVPEFGTILAITRNVRPQNDRKPIIVPTLDISTTG
jgi:hypothetical protein